MRPADSIYIDGPGPDSSVIELPGMDVRTLAAGPVSAFADHHAAPAVCDGRPAAGGSGQQKTKKDSEVGC